MAARPGRLPRAAQDAPQRAVRASSRSTPDRVDAALDGVRDRTATGARRRSRWGSGSRSPRRSGRSPARTPRDRPTPSGGSRRSCGSRRPRSTSRSRCSARGPTAIHALHSVMVPLDLADRLSVSVAPTGGEDSLHVTGFDPGRSRTTSCCARSPPPARPRDRPGAAPSRPRRSSARLDKRIPVAAGLAGGSSDAAAAADAALEAWGVTLDDEARAPAVRRGSARTSRSSSPAGPALVEGRGEQVTPLRLAPGRRPGATTGPGLLLVTPAVGDLDARRVPRPGTTARGSRGGAARLASDAPRRGAAHRACRVGDLLDPGVACSPRPTTSRPPPPSSSPASCRSSGRCSACSAGPSACPAPARSHWALYPSHVEAAAAAETLRAAARDRGSCQARAARRRSSPPPGSSRRHADTKREP